MSGYSSSDEEQIEEGLYGPRVYANNKMPPDAISRQIININTKSRIAELLQQIDPTIDLSNIDSTIQDQMTENGIEFNPNESNPQTKLNNLTELQGKLQEKLEQEKLEQKALQEKKGGKIRKSKRYRKSKKQRKTKTKRRLRRSYKYK